MEDDASQPLRASAHQFLRLKGNRAHAARAVLMSVSFVGILLLVGALLRPSEFVLTQAPQLSWQQGLSGETLPQGSDRPECVPKPAYDPCNPTLASSCSPAPDASKCIASDHKVLVFCAYASMHSNGWPNDAKPVCSINGKQPDFAPPPDPATAYVSVYSDMNCFASMKDAKDRLCIPRDYIPNIDCVQSSRLPGLLALWLRLSELDFKSNNDGRSPTFQCFHRGGYGSVGWFHLHAFDNQTDSFCPSMSNNPQMLSPMPNLYICTRGHWTLERRVVDVVQLMEYGGRLSIN
eukprot:6182248-Pleurochrysis_carterae.AAC.2